jgi:SNF2 family DNA or RNA helicase
LRSPDGRLRIGPGSSLHGTLRPYQLAGTQWLYLLARLGLGACLADDMGLGKTIPACWSRRLRCWRLPFASLPLLLVRFAPSLKAVVAHPSAMPAETLANGADLLAGADVAITSYGYLARASSLGATSWRLVVLDEAQAIKNPGAKQTRTVKGLKADTRIALTGTPIENRLGDLWSIFDFINPGLLGSSKQFSSFVKNLAARPHNPYGPLRELVRPYIPANNADGYRHAELPSVAIRQPTPASF